MANYQLIASEQTVQVLSPTLVNDVVYCTIQTSPSSVIASMPVDIITFNAGDSGTLLSAFAANIETLMARPEVVAGQGSQTIDANGLLQDQVSFTVSYTPTGGTPGAVTAQALVPVGLLEGGGDSVSAVLLREAEAIIAAVYANLKSAAGG